jgi:cardiolipin synthase
VSGPGLRGALKDRVGSTLDGLARRWRQTLVRFARKQKAELREGNDVSLFVCHGPLLAATRELIAQARRTVDVEMYIWSDDVVGREFVELLRAACGRGVAVRIVYDALGCLAGGAHIEALTACGAQVHAFHPVVPWRWRGNPNDRNHRKLVLIDDTAAVLGTGNWGLDYDSDRNPGCFVDIGFAVAGPLVGDLALDFRSIWREKVHQVLPPPQPPRGDIQLPGAPIPDVTAHMVSGITRGDRSAIRRLYMLLFGSASQDIWLASAYFVPGRRFLRALRSAAERGLDVHIVVPGKSDVAWVQAATRSIYEPLLRAGARIYERQQRMMHAKVAVLDGQVAVVGTANLDPRSFLHNLELTVNLHDARVAQELQGFVEAEIAESLEVRLEDVQRWSWFTKLVRQFAYAFAYWL